MRQVDAPDIVVDYAPPAQCDLCDAKLEGAEVIDKRQVFDLPPLCFEVTEHRLLQAQCACGKVDRGQFPDGVRAPVQYGPTVLAAMVHLSTHHMLPLKRTADLLSDFFRLPVSQAVVLQACSRASETLKPVVESIAQALQTAS